MKTVFALLMVAVLAMTGCANTGKIGNDPNSQAMGYVAGKAMGYGLNHFAPKSAPAIEASWKDMMTRNAALDPIPGAEFVAFFNQSVLTLGGEVKDPYGLLGDLSAFLMIYGASYAPDGKLLAVQDIPRSVARLFEAGYASGKQLATKTRGEV